jgi:hypothetical protein
MSTLNWIGKEAVLKPGFICQTKNGKVLVVEYYKGADKWDTRKTTA